MATFSHLWSSALTLELGTADSTKLFTDSRRKAAINNGLLAFADLTECLQRQSTFSCSHAVREYDLNSSINVPGEDFLRFAKQPPEFAAVDTAGVATFLSGEAFPRKDIAGMNAYEPGWRASTAGDPAGWYERVDGGARYFGFDTPPAINSSESAKVILPYIAKPAVLTSDTDVPFTFATVARRDLEPFVQASVHYAAYELEKLRLNEEASQRQLQTFLGYVQRLVQTFRPKGGSQVRLGRNYFTEVRTRRRDQYDGPVAKWW